VVALPTSDEAGEPSREDHYESGELWQIIDHVQEIYHIRRNIVDRLRRNADYLHKRLDYDATAE
jgi:hypothetical protein